MRPKGLCNAVIIARRGAEFLKRWLDSYEDFREDRWTEHSVVGRPEWREWRVLSWLTLFLGDAVDISSDVPYIGDCLVREDVLLASLDR